MSPEHFGRRSWQRAQFQQFLFRFLRHVVLVKEKDFKRCLLSWWVEGAIKQNRSHPLLMGRNSAAYFFTSKEKTHLTIFFASFHAGFTLDHPCITWNISCQYTRQAVPSTSFFGGYLVGNFDPQVSRICCQNLFILFQVQLRTLLSATSSISDSSFDVLNLYLYYWSFLQLDHGYIMFHPYVWWQDLPACLFQLSATESASAVSGVPLLTMSSSVSLGTLGPQTPFQKEYWVLIIVGYSASMIF